MRVAEAIPVSVGDNDVHQSTAAQRGNKETIPRHEAAMLWQGDHHYNTKVVEELIGV